MTAERRGFFRDNAFLVAAVALPAFIALFFIGANAIPHWTVPDPAYDLVFRAAHPYEANPAAVTVDFIVRNGQVEALVRPAPPQSYTPRWGLLRFNHASMQVREIPLDLPAMVPEGETLTIPVTALAGERLVDDVVAPDGYRLHTDGRAGGGIVGDLFGMRRSRSGLSLARNGRVIAIPLPPPYDTAYAQTATIGWIADEGR